MQKVLSSKDRASKIVQDIVFDMETKPRLQDGQGNAMLVASSIYEAAKYYELFQSTPLRGKCAVISSYNAHHSHVVLEETGE
jgi:type I restriction enzyme R subunit